MKMLLNIFAFLFLISCNQVSNNEDQPYEDRRPICDAKNGSSVKKAGCLPPMPKWIISVNRTRFPDNALIKVEGKTLLDECSGDDSPFIIDRNGSVVIEAENFFNPGDDDFSFEIVDLESNCLGTNSYYKNDNQSFIITGEGRNQLLEFSID